MIKSAAGGHGEPTDEQGIPVIPGALTWPSILRAQQQGRVRIQGRTYWHQGHIPVPRTHFSDLLDRWLYVESPVITSLEQQRFLAGGQVR